MKTITSKVIGDLTQDEEFNNWWHAEFIPIPFFDNTRLCVTMVGFTPGQDYFFLQQADEALSNFLQKGKDDRLAISSFVFDNLEDFKCAAGTSSLSEELKELENEQSIWNFVTPHGITVQRRHRRDQDIYISISLNCEWEEEHGLQLVFRQGKKLTRVSSLDGHLTDADAYGLSDDKDKLLSAY
ncbi:DUF6985 domain-containing protein [Niastella populi]|uniref:DUF6985 domain-containing protein n=1 Tax=Niastella populi TaxID=550983 RepID=A0A1V9GDP4_9BACT|nr:hypothetical protein [Niastella populi]OQP68667.1 hypothetical protein A4R26_01010 [Niastella populi]